MKQFVVDVGLEPLERLVEPDVLSDSGLEGCGETMNDRGTSFFLPRSIHPASQDDPPLVAILFTLG